MPSTRPSSRTGSPDPTLSMSDSATPPSRTPRPHPASGALPFLLEVVKVVVFALAIIVPIRYFLVQPFYVKGASMEPNFEDHEYLLIDEISYRFREPARGEVVVLRNPSRESEFFIKRIVGLPGDTVQFEDGRIRIVDTVNPSGFILDESAYLAGGIPTNAQPGRAAFTLALKQYLVLGDNRPFSLDGRSFGPIPRREIVGRVWIRAFPLNRFDLFSAPAYQISAGTVTL